MNIAIIGAGLAGLTTAYRLHQRGVNVNVFEARNRVGGRVLTCSMKNYLGEESIVELGGQNITDGGDADNIKALIDELSLTTQARAKHVILNSSICYQNKFYDLRQTLIDYCNAHPDMEDRVNALTQQCSSMGELVDRVFVHSPILKQAFIARLTAYEGIDAYQQCIYHNIDTLRYSMRGGIAKSHEAYNHQPNHIVIKSLAKGNAQLPLRIAATLGDKVYLNKTLKAVQQADEQTRLVFADDSFHNCDVVVITIPVSTFSAIDWTQSKIAPQRLAQMQRLSYGHNYKIAIPFDLSQRNQYRSLMFDHAVSFSNHDETISLLYVNDPNRDMSAAIKLMRTGHTITGDYGSYITKALDQQYQFYNGAVEYVWAHDPYALGSYSGYSIGLSSELDERTYYYTIEFKKLFAPINNQIYFAGEHTTLLDCIGTMEAAVESGERVARAINYKMYS